MQGETSRNALGTIFPKLSKTQFFIVYYLHTFITSIRVSFLIDQPDLLIPNDKLI